MEKVLLVGVNSGRDAEFERSMEELENLAQACDLEVAARTAQNLSAVNTAFYIGSGKVEEVGRMAQMLEVQLIIFNDSLTPTQQRNLQKALDLPVWDRTGLILEIFGRRARTRPTRKVTPWLDTLSTALQNVPRTVFFLRDSDTGQ